MNNSNNLLNQEETKRIELKLQTQSVRQLFIKIEIIDENNNIVSEVAGSAMDGSYNIDNSSAIRRTCSITFKLEDGYLPTEDSVFWINKKFKLYIGLKRIENNEIYWFDKGTYAIKDPNINIAISDNTITINGLDKMALHTGDISGQLEDKLIIQAVEDDGSQNMIYVEDAIDAVMKDGGETNLLIAKTNLLVPHNIEANIGDVRWDIISKLQELFYNYQAYYNLDGYFVFSAKPIYQSNNEVTNNIAINFSKDAQEYQDYHLVNIPYNLIVSIDREIAYSNVKNKIVVYGGVHSDGYQPSYTIIVNDENYLNSPYTVEKLNETTSDGSRMYRTYVVQDDSYTNAILDFKQYDADDSSTKITYPYNTCVKYKNNTEDTYYLCINKNGVNNENASTPNNDTESWQLICTETALNEALTNNNNDVVEEYLSQIHAYAIQLCQERALQEVYLHQQATDTVSITCLPIYSLDVNQVIYVDDKKSGAVGEYVINSISCGLDAGSTMTINANKLW